MSELLDIKIFITQLIGFLILVLVLRRVAWGPILGAMEARRKRIADEVAASERLRKEAEELKAKYEQDLRHIEAQARERIQEAVAEGQKVAEEIRAQARAEAQAQRDKTKADLEQEYRKAQATLHDDVVRIALGAAGRLLREEMNQDRQKKLVEQFLAELPEVRTS